MIQVNIWILFIFSIDANAQTPMYETTYQTIEEMLTGEQPLSFKEAVFLVEAAYFDNEDRRGFYETEISVLTQMAQQLEHNREIIYDLKDKAQVKKYAALYTLMTDTLQLHRGMDTVQLMPFQYDFNDVFGRANWENMFVTKLLATRKGNCHSLPYLYKILSDELGVDTYLALAPNHLYIKHKSELAGWYNTELTNASFPIDAWLMASGFIHLDAIQNGIYMKALGNKESIAMCLIDLAMGFNKKFPDNDGTFVLQCCETALQHFPNYINGLLVKANTQQRQIKQMMDKYQVQSPNELSKIIPSSKVLWEEMEATYLKIHQLGYRQMPKQMYLDWLFSLEEEREKYQNPKVNFDERN